MEFDESGDHFDKLQDLLNFSILISDPFAQNGGRFCSSGPISRAAPGRHTRAMSGMSNGTLLHQAMPKGRGQGSSRERRLYSVGIWPPEML